MRKDESIILSKQNVIAESLTSQISQFINQ